MTKRSVFQFLLGTGLLGLGFCVCAPVLVWAYDPVPQVPTQVRELFNGENLDGWYTFLANRGVDSDPNGVFTVADGAIRISGQEFGCITTKEAFRDYRLTVEFKWGEKRWGGRENCTRDSGLLIHSVGEDGAFGGIWLCSIETNIIEGGLGDFIVVGDGTDAFSLTAETAPEKSKMDCYIWQKGGQKQTIHGGRIDWYGRDPDWADTADFHGRNDLDKVGEWNTLEVVADGDRVDVYVNGTMVNQGLNVSPSAGRIQLQSEAAEVFFRKVTIAPLDK